MWLDPVAESRLQEYQYRQLFPISHDQYEDEPIETIEWMLQIHEARMQVEQKLRGRRGATDVE